MAKPSFLIHQFIDDNLDATCKDASLASGVSVLPLHSLFLPYTKSAFVIDVDFTVTVASNFSQIITLGYDFIIKVY